MLAMVEIGDDPQTTLKELFEHPTTMRIFFLLKTQNTQLGVREIQRKLDLGSPSTAYWHLNKMRDYKVIEQLPNNEYRLKKEYSELTQIEIPTRLPYTMIGNYAIPTIFTPIAFLVILIVGIIVMMIMGNIIAAAISGLLGLIFALVLILNYVYRNISWYTS